MGYGVDAFKQQIITKKTAVFIIAIRLINFSYGNLMPVKERPTDQVNYILDAY